MKNKNLHIDNAAEQLVEQHFIKQNLKVQQHAIHSITNNTPDFILLQDNQIKGVIEVKSLRDNFIFQLLQIPDRIKAKNEARKVIISLINQIQTLKYQQCHSPENLKKINQLLILLKTKGILDNMDIYDDFFLNSEITHIYPLYLQESWKQTWAKLRNLWDEQYLYTVWKPYIEIPKIFTKHFTKISKQLNVNEKVPRLAIFVEAGKMTEYNKEGIEERTITNIRGLLRCSKDYLWYVVAENQSFFQNNPHISGLALLIQVDNGQSNAKVKTKMIVIKNPYALFEWNKTLSHIRDDIYQVSSDFKNIIKID